MLHYTVLLSWTTAAAYKSEHTPFLACLLISQLHSSLNILHRLLVRLTALYPTVVEPFAASVRHELLLKAVARQQRYTYKQAVSLMIMGLGPQDSQTHFYGPPSAQVDAAKVVWLRELAI